ncbi:MAG: hypothetical protein JWN72_2708 [Thermoleophilia bacterium]|nr:hypothetical protein [Thermoleophilia bacterium]
MRRILTTLSIAFVAILALAAPALAASPAQIFRDLDDNGVLDGKYSAADLRAADKAVTAQQREYGGWDDAYAAALTRALAPKPRPGVKVPDITPETPKDVNGNGAIDPNEKAAADKVTADKEARAIIAANAGSADDADAPDGAIEEGGEPVDKPKAEAAANKDDDGDKTVVAIVLIVLAALLGATIWRVIVNRRRNHGDPRAARDEFRPENEGRNDLEHDARLDETQTIDTTPLEPGLDPDGSGRADSGISDVGPDDPRA